MSRALALAALTALSLAACSRDSAEIGAKSGAGPAKGTLSRMLPFGKPTPAQPASAEQIAASALQSIEGPVLLAQFDNGATVIFAERGRNGEMRTYLSPDGRSLSLRGGMIAATRGFGRDVMSSDATQSAALVSARQGGTVPRVQYYLDGDGRERPYPMTCTITPTEPVTQGTGDQSLTVTPVTELCEPAQAQNSYMVNEAGQIIASRQWIGPRMGYLTITALRD
ncbi:YjbF family lipoprotein [Thioclava sp. A2]|uniref:YjbF family lipoprotein n=1 Tax=Thioclava sp. FCG-A2 TaxID=3080562 RepID=UPI002954D5FC|nr:YjbF family lipoprotein [Thioclava sp. A2]MDV7271440.1 YjbF family lipoprotein [Thioclava sp. A2]